MPDEHRSNARSGDGPQAFGDLLGSVTRQVGLNRSKPAHPSFKAWDDVAGPELARVARPVRFRAGELAIDVSTATHYHELVAFTGEGLRRRVNDLLGEEIVRKLVFKQRTQE